MMTGTRTRGDEARTSREDIGEPILHIRLRLSDIVEDGDRKWCATRDAAQCAAIASAAATGISVYTHVDDAQGHRPAVYAVCTCNRRGKRMASSAE